MTTVSTRGRGAGAAVQVRRLLNLVPYLIKHPGARVADVAAEFDVSEAQLRKDLEVLWMCGLPDGLPDDLMEAHVTEGGAIYLDNAEAIVRPLRLSTREAVALLVALRALAQLPGLADRDALIRASAKLAEACGDAADAADRVRVAFEAREAVVDTVQRALAEQRRLSLDYYVPSRDVVTTRQVDALRLVFSDGRGYLEAWCYSSDAVRLFRLDRVVSLSLLAEAASPPETVMLRDLDSGVLGTSDTDPVVTVDVAPESRWVTENYPCDIVAELSDGWLRVRLRTGDLGWVRRLMLRLGAAGRVVDPPELASALRETARDALAGYDEPTVRAL